MKRIIKIIIIAIIALAFMLIPFWAKSQDTVQDTATYVKFEEVVIDKISEPNYLGRVYYSGSYWGGTFHLLSETIERLQYNRIKQTVL